MQYKTIVLELLKQRTELHEQLRMTRRLLPTLETCAKELKASHEAWKETLAQAKPGSDPSQIASEALELALKELEDRLPSVSPQDDGKPLSLDQAMAFVRSHTSSRLRASRQPAEPVSTPPPDHPRSRHTRLRRIHRHAPARSHPASRSHPRPTPSTLPSPAARKPRPATSSPPSAR